MVCFHILSLHIVFIVVQPPVSPTGGLFHLLCLLASALGEACHVLWLMGRRAGV